MVNSNDHNELKREREEKHKRTKEILIHLFREVFQFLNFLISFRFLRDSFYFCVAAMAEKILTKSFICLCDDDDARELL